MLAYELYCENKDDLVVSGNGHPIKKIFVKNNSIEIDCTTIDEFGKSNIADSSKNTLQELLEMPIDTNPKINLPNKTVSSNSPKPYIKISGYAKLTKKKGQEHVSGEITLGNIQKKEPPYAKLSFPNYDEEIFSADISLNLNKLNYQIDGKLLYDAYVENQIIKNDKLSATLFEKITKIFFEFVKDKQIKFNLKTPFALYILPSNKKITFQNKKNVSSTSFTDAFGNDGILPDKPTADVKFLSYDDPAFTINCNIKQKFYENLGISEKSHSKIILPKNKMMTMSGFEWYFTNLQNPKDVFRKHNRGIYYQLSKNYSELDTTDNKANTCLKIFCIKKTNAKLEIMIDENLTMSHMREIFKNLDEEIPHNAYETLIIIRGRKKIFRYYIRAIKSLLNQIDFKRTQLISIFSEQIHEHIRDWLKMKSNNDAIEFFKKTEFCIKTLNHTQMSTSQLNEEDFAKSIGRMTRAYVDFRKKTDNDNNSIKDLLSKPKYDVKTLKFVIKSIGRGTHLLNIDKNDYDMLVSKLTALTPKEEVANTHNDLSYHFYMGYFGESS